VIHIIDRGNKISVCGKLKRGDTLVVPAMESDCNDCRGLLFIGPTNQRGCAVRPTLTWTSEPPLRDRDGNLYERDRS
jgi:hypothetical protein